MPHSNAPPDFWSGDYLDRRSDANFLTKFLVNRYETRSNEQGFVMAINAEWGYGKTFMLERWRDDLIHRNHPTVYFDAWKNDFTPQPLVAFIAEIDAGLTQHFSKIPAAKRAFKNAMKSVKPLLNSALRVAGAALVKQVVGTSLEQIVELHAASSATPIAENGSRAMAVDAKAVTESLEKIVDDALKQHKGTKEAISTFRTKLELLIQTLISESSVQLPVFIFVDELDRCRPTYAIELLEGIKHLFGVPGIYFIVATNIPQLAESTKVIYGSGFDGENYLKRFFDLEYALPEPSSTLFSQALWVDVPKPSEARIILGYIQPDNNGEVIQSTHIPYVFEQYMKYFGRGLRDQFQVMRIIEAALLSLPSEVVHIHLLFFLATLYQRSPTIFRAVARAKNLSSATGFDTLKVFANDGRFFATKLNDDPFKAAGQKIVGIPEVAKIYFDSMPKTYRDLRLEEINPYDFPRNLLLSLQRNPIPGKEYISPFEKYFEIVRHAGGFAGRTQVT